MKTEEYRQEAELAIDSLFTEVFYMNNICDTEDKVKEVIHILQDLRGYTERLEDKLILELDFIQRQCKDCIYYDFKDSFLDDYCKNCINNSNFKDNDDECID